MLSFTGSLRVFVALENCDMRKGFDGLLALVTVLLCELPFRGLLLLKVHPSWMSTEVSMVEGE